MKVEQDACKNCGGQRFVKNGSSRGVQKLKCKTCGVQSDVLARPEGERIEQDKHFKSYPKWMRHQAIALYCLGLSLTAIGKFLKIGTTTVMRWVAHYAREECAKPIPGSAAVVEIDEMWHFLKKSPVKSGSGKFTVGILDNSSTGSWVIATLPPSKNFRND